MHVNLFEDAEPGGPLAPDVGDSPRRALIMAGGGLKVAFQAGVLQVWLDEARSGGRPLEFAHADGASGGVYNLAMWCQGMSGRAIADNWRRFRPVVDGLDVDPRGGSLFTLDRFRSRVLRESWGLDWSRIRASERSAGFNVFSVDEQRLVTLPPAAMSEDMLVASTSLPMWYPAVPVGGKTYIDGVFVTDANLDAAIAAGADELWIVWTVSAAGRWRLGPVNQYFQVIEACANGRLRQDLDRIARSNRAHAAGEASEFGRPIRVVALQHEVPMHYLFTFTRSRVAAAVELGVATARAWCHEHGLDVDPRAEHPAVAGPAEPVTFRETMAGTVAFGGLPPGEAADVGDALGERMALHLRVRVADLAAFRSDPAHLARVGGDVDCPALGGRLPIRRGTLSLLPTEPGGAGSVMEYRLDVADGCDRKLTLVGVKTVHNDPGPDMWADTTTLDVHAFAREDGPPVLSGRLRITPWALMRTVASSKGSGRAGYGRFFAGRMLALYARTRPAPTRPVVRPLPGWPPHHHPDGARVFVHNERLIPAPPERVWEVLVDAGSWSSYYRNAWFVRVPGGVLRRGTVFRWVTFGLPLRSVVTRFDPATGVLGWNWRGPGARGYHLWSLQPHPLGTLVVTEETQRGPLPRLLAPLLRRVMPAGHERWLRGLARRAVRDVSGTPGVPPRVSSDPALAASS